MPYGHISAAGLPVTGAGGALGIGWLVAAGVTMILAGLVLSRLVPVRQRGRHEAG